MKKTVNGLTYNTETAKEIGYYSKSYYCNDFNYYSESLYKTKTGNYFLYGSGNAMSKYSCSVGNIGRGGSSDIIPMTEAEAMEWCEEYDQDSLENHFSHNLEEA
jgi:hypothetical protein